MSLEALMTKMTESMDALTKELAAARTGKSSPAVVTTTKPTATVTALKPAGLDFDSLKVAAVKVQNAKGKPFAKNLIVTVGGAKEMAAVKPEKYAALMKAFEGALVADEPAEEEVEEDEDL